MKALVLDEEKRLHITNVDQPSPKAGEVQIRIQAAALNHREIWITKGLYPGMKLPCILGADGAGVISAIGEGVDADWMGVEVIIYPAYDWGDDDDRPLKQFRVLGMPDPGTIAEYITVPATHVVHKPKYLSWEEAAAIPVASLTAWRALHYHARVRKGDKVLITGIGGGVAQAGLQLAFAMGAEVFVTSSDISKIDRAISSGATAGVNYKEEDWYDQLKIASGGIDAVLDSSPSEELDNYLKFLNHGARIVAYGSTGSRKTTLNISKFFLRHIQFIGTAMGSNRDFLDLINFIERHEIKPVVDSVFKLDQSEEAIRYLSEGAQVGKVVISMKDS